MSQIDDDLAAAVERPFLADQRPTNERDDRLGRASYAKGMSRPVPVTQAIFRPSGFRSM
ncbi:hypothetical protein OKW45_007856 [Paraburkholderia sp. WSM4175]|uniref:hypothetical protein n=1 Tax=Paraburkholderia sp. WSM4175 TaxID=2991072 RepID=UPI003D1AE0D9